MVIGDIFEKSASSNLLGLTTYNLLYSRVGSALDWYLNSSARVQN